MKKKSKNTNYQNSWNLVMQPEMLRKIFDDIKLSDWKIKAIEDVFVFSRDEAGCIANTTCGDQEMKVYLSFLIGAPRWSHFMDLVYEHGKTTDIQIIACSEEFSEDWDNDPSGNIFGIGELAKYYNERGCRIFVIKMRNLPGILKGDIDEPLIEIIQGLTEAPDIYPDDHQEIPTKKELQESEFWLEYYWPIWGSDCYEVYDCLRSCEPHYFFNNCKQKALWTDNGFALRITALNGPEFLKWLWFKGQTMIKKELPDCTIHLLGSEDVPAGIDIRLLDLPLTELLSLSSDDKQGYAVYVYDMEHVGSSIMFDIEDEYEKFKKEISL